MSFFPKIIDPLDPILDLGDFIDEDRWSRIEYKDIEPEDRVLCVRIASGIRTISEAVVTRYDESLGAWVNGLGSPVVSILDIHIFRAGEPRDDQSKEYRETVLGG